MKYEERQLLKQKIDEARRAKLPVSVKAHIVNRSVDPDFESRKKTRDRIKKLADEGFKVLDFQRIQCITCGRISNRYATRKYAHEKDCKRLLK